MTKAKKALNWEEAIKGAGALPKGQARKPFAERAREAEAWAQEMDGAPAGRPIVRMGRPGKGGPVVTTELVSFRTDKLEKAALEALAQAQGQSLSELLRGVTHTLVSTFRAGQKTGKVKV